MLLRSGASRGEVVIVAAKSGGRKIFGLAAAAGQ